MSEHEFQDTLAEKATELFRLCDHEDKGYIIEDDLVLVTEELGLPLSQEQIALTFTKLDKDNNNYLTLAEFISGFGLFLGAQEGEESSFQATDYSQGHQLFDLCDRERKGYIVKSDLERLSAEFQLSEQQLGDLFHSLDQDGNGYLTLEEFVVGFGKFLAFETNGQADYTEITEVNTPVEKVYENHLDSAVINSPGLSEDAIFEKIADKVGDDLLSGMLSKGQLRELWKALSSNDVAGFEKLTEFLTKVSQEIKHSRTQALNVEQTLKGQVEAHELEIQKLYETMDTQLNAERQDINSHHEKKEKEIRERFLSEMESKEQDLQELLKQQKELERKIDHLNQADSDVREENDRLLETNYHLQSELDESTSSLKDTKSYVEHLQSLTVEERKERTSTAMTIVQGMQKEQENLIKQLDVLREVNQNLRDQKDAIQAAHEANLERSPAKIHRAVTRQGSEMSKYFATFDAHSGVSRTNSRLISVDEAGEANPRSGSGKRKLHRTKGSTQSIQSSSSAQHLIELASESDGAEFECDRVFEDGELKESERPEWMEKVHSALEPVMSAANRKKTKRELGERQTDIAPQLADEVDGAEFEDYRVFKERELKDGDKPEWIGKVHSTTEPAASEAERMKAEREFGERRTNIVPQSTEEGKSSRKPLTTSDGVQFKEGELRESEGHEWMEKVNSATEPVMSEAERMKTEREFREHKTNIVPQFSVEGKSSHKSPTSEEEEEAGSQSSERTLSPRTSPVGTETETKHVHNTSLFPATNSHLQRVYKVVFVGDSGVGKSSFIHRYCYEIWKPSYTATIGVDFQVKSLEIGMKKLALQLWDTAGQERFRSITKQYFRKADGVVLLYDLTSEASFVNIKSWMTSVEEAAEPGCTVMLIGNKLDLCKDDKRYRAVEFTNAEELAEEYGALYAEASAKTGENVNEAMEILAKRLQEEEDWQIHSVLNLKLDEDKKKKKSCCSK